MNDSPEICTEGHRFDVIVRIGSTDPREICCVNCSRSWQVEAPQVRTDRSMRANHVERDFAWAAKRPRRKR